jgi:GT2 family glycosyltransferase
LNSKLVIAILGKKCCDRGILLIPKVSILWVNYNSLSFINLALESLQAIKNLDYPNYELIVVDNGSVDGSFEIIKKFINESNIKSKLIRLNRNLGFTGGNNVAYAARDPNSKYVVLLNSDAVPRKDSLSRLVEIMENDESLGAAQGVILNYDEKSIDTAGDFISEILTDHPLLEGKPPNSLKKAVFITSADAAYSIFRVEAIKKLSKRKDVIFDDLFACFDDYLLGLKIWNAGYKIKTFPIIIAKHNRGSSFSKVKHLQLYLCVRNSLMINEISNSRYKIIVRVLFFRQLFGWLMAKFLNLVTEPEHQKLPALFSKAFTDGIKIGRVKKRQQERIDIYKAPVLKVELTDVLLKIIKLQGLNSKIKKKTMQPNC